ncbi:MAG: hypothetical protein AB1498_07490 [bacterium]
MLTPRKIFKGILIIFIVYLISISMAVVEVLSRAKEAYNEGKEYFALGLEWENKGDIPKAFDYYMQALWAQQTVEQILTSYTVKKFPANEVKTGMILADPIYPDGIREAEPTRQDPKEMIAESYIPLTGDQVIKIKASNIDYVHVPNDFSLTQRSKWIALSKAEMPKIKEKIEFTKPKFPDEGRDQKPAPDAKK